MENQPLLKGNDSAHDFTTGADSGRGRGGSGGSVTQAYSPLAVFAVFFFPALGGLLFG